MDEARKKYADIIDREHHISSRHPQMPRINRAAQFSPFAALVGYDDLIRESARTTDRELDLDDSVKAELDYKLRFLYHQDVAVNAAFTYFVPDARKSGGHYEIAAGKILKYDQLSNTILLDTGDTIRIDRISDIQSDVFDEEE